MKINEKQIPTMKIKVINRSRFALPEYATEHAAGLDVVADEPITASNPLLKAKNCLITPHISWAPKESRQRLMDVAVENLRAYLRSEAVNVVNP